MANFLSFSLLVVLLIVQAGLSFKCYECDPRVDIECSKPKLSDCSGTISPLLRSLLPEAKTACMTMVAYSILEDRVVGKNCILDLSSMGFDQCDVAKKVAMKTARGKMYNVTCEICKTDSCNSGGTITVDNVEVTKLS